MSDWRTIRNWSRDEMLKRVARFRKLKGSDGGLPDSPLPECRRKLFNVIGFQPPPSGDSPVGANASAMPAIPIAEMRAPIVVGIRHTSSAIRTGIGIAVPA